MEILKKFVIKHSDNIIGIQIHNLFTNLMKFKEILEFNFTLKKVLPNDLLWILSGKYNVADIPLATYLGFDLFDLTEIGRAHV